MYDHIVVPLDGSTFAESAIPLAMALSRRTRAGVHFVTVLEPIPSFAYDEWDAAAREWTGEYLKGVVERTTGRSGGPVSTAILSGQVVEELEGFVESVKADVIVMATHGRGMMSRMWLGSVADSFLHRTDRPIVMVRPQDGRQPEVNGEHRFSTILVPLDGSDLSEAALDHAVAFGELFDAAYHLTRVVAYPMDIASPYLPQTVQMNQAIVDEAREGAANYLEERAERMRRRGLRVTTSVIVDAQAGHGILREIEEVGCDMIAMATHGRAGLSRAILGSAADKVLRGTTVPLLLYRPPDSA
jgi:nucleotide-binding universal stress UspA family protein